MVLHTSPSPPKRLAWRVALVLALPLVAIGCGGDSDTPPAAAPHATRLAATDGNTCAVCSDGRVFCWSKPPSSKKPVVPLLQPSPVETLEIAVGHGEQRCARDSLGYVWCWGPTGGQTIALNGERVADAAQLVGSTGIMCLRRATGRVVCWGRNDLGQLGNGITSDSTADNPPAEVIGLDDAVDISVSGGGGCAVRAGGEVVCWGTSVDDKCISGEPQRCTNCAAGGLVPCPLEPVLGVSGVRSVAVAHGGACGVLATGKVAPGKVAPGKRVLRARRSAAATASSTRSPRRTKRAATARRSRRA